MARGVGVSDERTKAFVVTTTTTAITLRYQPAMRILSTMEREIIIIIVYYARSSTVQTQKMQTHKNSHKNNKTMVVKNDEKYD